MSKAFCAGAALIVLTAVCWIETRDLEIGTLSDMGPGLWIRSILCLIMAFGFILIASSFSKSNSTVEKIHFRGPTFIAIAILSFAFMIPNFGLAVAVPSTVLIAGLASREARLIELLPLALGVTIVAIGLFPHLLGQSIPVLIIPGMFRY